MLDALRAIGVVARALDSIANIEFRDLNLTRGQYLYLVRIVEQPGIIQEQLVNQLKVDRATVARSVAKLTDQGLVTKRPDPANGKANRLYPTAAGQAAYVPIHQENAYSLHQALAGMSQKRCRRSNAYSIKCAPTSTTTGNSSSVAATATIHKEQPP